VPNGVEGLFYPCEQGDDGPEQQGDTERAQDGEVEITHIGQDVLADLGALVAQRLQCLHEHRFELVLDPEALEHRKGDSQQGDQGEQDRIGEAG